METALLYGGKSKRGPFEVKLTWPPKQEAPTSHHHHHHSLHYIEKLLFPSLLRRCIGFPFQVSKSESTSYVVLVAAPSTDDPPTRQRGAAAFFKGRWPQPQTRFSIKAEVGCCISNQTDGYCKEQGTTGRRWLLLTYVALTYPPCLLQK